MELELRSTSQGGMKYVWLVTYTVTSPKAATEWDTFIIKIPSDRGDRSCDIIPLCAVLHAATDKREYYWWVCIWCFSSIYFEFVSFYRSHFFSSFFFRIFCLHRVIYHHHCQWVYHSYWRWAEDIVSHSVRIGRAMTFVDYPFVFRLSELLVFCLRIFGADQAMA